MDTAGTTDTQDTEPVSRGDKRRAAFIAAARAVFLEQGYEAASMSDIVLRAGGSLSTLYSQFGDKQGLFLAMLDERIRQITASMGVELSAHAPVADGLRRIGQQFTSKLLEPESLEMYRLILGLARKFPEIPREFARRGPDRLRQALADYLIDRRDPTRRPLPGRQPVPGNGARRPGEPCADGRQHSPEPGRDRGVGQRGRRRVPERCDPPQKIITPVSENTGTGCQSVRWV